MKYISKNRLNKRKQQKKQIKKIMMCTCAGLLFLCIGFFVWKGAGNISLPTFSFQFFGKNQDKNSFPVTAFGRTIETPALKVASLSPMASQALLSMPGQNRLVAVSEYCNKKNQDIPTIGTPLIPKVDAIIDLMPEYLLVQTPLSVENQNKIEQAGIKILQISAPENFVQLQDFYTNLGYLFFGQTKGDQLAQSLVSDMQEKLKRFSLSLSGNDKYTCLTLLNSYGMVVTSDTLEYQFLQNFFHLANTGSDYYSGTFQELAASNPQVIIAPESMDKQTLADLGFDTTDAYLNDRLFFIPLGDFENYAPSSILQLGEIAVTVYGDKLSLVSEEQLYPDEHKKD